MALLTLNECAEQTTARSGRDASYSRRFVLNYDAAVDEKTAREETGIPRVGYVHPRSNYSVVTDVTADPIDGNRRQAWMVVCVYQSRRGGVASSVTKNEPGQLYDNPLERKPRVRFGTSLYSMPISQAYGNNNRLEVDIKNSAGDPFDPPPQADRHHGTFVYMRNEAMYDPTLAERYVNTCNSVDWLYWSKGKVRCDGIEAEFLFESGVQYYAVTYQFAIHPETWRLRLMDVLLRLHVQVKALERVFV